MLGTLPFVGEGPFPVDTTVGAGLGRRRALDLSTLSPEGLVIREDKFFIRTGCPDPLPPTTSWKVRVHGLVAKPTEISVEELKREATPMGAHLLECAGNSRGAHFGFMGVARWTGVPLERVLERMAPSPARRRVLVSGFDQHSTPDLGSVPGASWIFSRDQIREAGAFLATEMNGAPLGPDHGYPLRLVVPGWYGCTAIKWVNEIALVDDEAPATDHMREYAGRTHQEPAGPRDDALLRAGRRPEGPPLARDFQPATIDPAALPVRVEKLAAADGRISYRIVGILWGGRTPRARPPHPHQAARGRSAGPEDRERATSPVDPLVPHLPAAGTRHAAGSSSPSETPGVRTRRLDMGFYARDFEIATV